MNECGTADLRLFLAECTVISPGDRVRSRAMYDAYKAWCLVRDVTPWSWALFSRKVREAGQQKIRASTMWWVGIRIASSAQHRSDGLEQLEAAWRAASPADALAFLQSRLRALQVRQ